VRRLEREELGEGNARWISVVCCGPGDGIVKARTRMMKERMQSARMFDF
jgi:hypothetical protein